MDDSVFVHIVSFNSGRFIEKAVLSVLEQEGLSALGIHVTDNASEDETCSVLERLSRSHPVTFERNERNFGFCGAHNQGVKRFLDGPWKYVLVLNPDVVLDPQCIRRLCAAIDPARRVGLVTPKLFRADDDLRPGNGRLLDAAGMMLTSSLRHFDRGSNSADSYDREETVFGGTGACLLLERSCVLSLLLKGRLDELKSKVHPELAERESERVPLFDEAFFAYREDADLCWRAGVLGWQTRFVPSAVGWHRRVVLPENRRELSPELNGLSVRNRFLLQINNYFPGSHSWETFINGFLVRNFTVIAGVLLTEFSSLRYLRDVVTLFPRALERRRILRERVHAG